ncbi:MAG: c-type cytochrome [Acidiferrobacteraceae bacterium]
MKEHEVPERGARARRICAQLITITALSLAWGAAHAAGNPVAGRIKSFQCAGCHLIPGYRVAYPVLYNVPKLGGQHATYIINALHEYQEKQRSSKTMQAIAAGLSEQDIQNLAAYFSGKTAVPAAAPAASGASKP